MWSGSTPGMVSVVMVSCEASKVYIVELVDDDSSAMLYVTGQSRGD